MATRAKLTQLATSYGDAESRQKRRSSAGQLDELIPRKADAESESELDLQSFCIGIRKIVSLWTTMIRCGRATHPKLPSKSPMPIGSQEGSERGEGGRRRPKVVSERRR
jgi:hypothetical protein